MRGLIALRALLTCLFSLHSRGALPTQTHSVDGGDTNSRFCTVSNWTATSDSLLNMSRHLLLLSPES